MLFFAYVFITVFPKNLDYYRFFPSANALLNMYLTAYPSVLKEPKLNVFFIFSKFFFWAFKKKKKKKIFFLLLQKIV